MLTNSLTITWRFTIELPSKIPAARLSRATFWKAPASAIPTSWDRAPQPELGQIAEQQIDGLGREVFHEGADQGHLGGSLVRRANAREHEDFGEQRVGDGIGQRASRERQLGETVTVEAAAVGGVQRHREPVV